jgi:hypothetical protein
MMEAVRTSETSVDNHFTRQYNPEDSSEHHIQICLEIRAIHLCLWLVDKIKDFGLKFKFGNFSQHPTHKP